MPQLWNTAFLARMSRFEQAQRIGPDHVSLSVKIRVTSGCFHGEHSPHAYRLIGDYVADIPEQQIDFVLKEHEGGPEVLVYVSVAATTAMLALSEIAEKLLTPIERRPKDDRQAR